MQDPISHTTAPRSLHSGRHTAQHLLSPLANNNNADATAIEGTRSKQANTAQTTGTEVDSVRAVSGT
jgi:Ser-tRNA(Ala) deacylase AlaX